MARILVIDDDPLVRAIVLDVLGSAGHEVVLATNGIEGLDAQRRAPADVAVVDLFMPEKEGFETIQELAREFPGVKLVAMSGGGWCSQAAPYLLTARTLGVGAVLKKPFDAPALLGTIDRLLGSPH